MNYNDVQLEIDTTINRIKNAADLLYSYAQWGINGKAVDMVTYSAENIIKHAEELESIIDNPLFECGTKSEKTSIRSDENETQTAPPARSRGALNTINIINEISFTLKAVHTAINTTNERIFNNHNFSYLDECVRDEFNTIHNLIYLAEDKLYIEIGKLDKLSKELEQYDTERETM